MPMPPYPIYCYTRGCGNLADFKIAARWSDGLTQELKTYGLFCPTCLPTMFRRSQERNRACRRAPGEKLDPPGIYRFVAGQRDVERQRLSDLEQQLSVEAC
jgi:hypothetical protein